MKTIKSFENFKNLRDYLKNYRDEQINEGVNLKDLISKGKEALKTWFFNSLNKIMDLAVKSNQIAKSIMKAILKFTKKYPKLTKVMVMFLVIVVLMVVSAQSAMASTSGPEMGTEW